MSDETQEPFVSVCVGSIRGTTLPDLVHSIRSQTYEAWELVICVQGRDPVLLDYVDRLDDPRITVVRLDVFGRSRALNAAVDQARGSILAFTDDDCEADPNWLEEIVRAFRQHPEVGLVGGSLLPPPKPSFRVSVCPSTFVIDSIFDPAERPDGPEAGFHWGGGDFALARWAKERIGPFDDYLGVGSDYPSAEDVDYALRAEMCGIPVMTRSSIVINHTNGRRVGVRAALRHHRGYARGSGALAVKIRRWGHRLASEWKTDYTLGSLVTPSALRRPHRLLLEVYRRKHILAAARSYEAAFVPADDGTSRPRTGDEARSAGSTARSA